jgi:hypothetical protein
LIWNQTIKSQSRVLDILISTIVEEDLQLSENVLKEYLKVVYL